MWAVSRHTGERLGGCASIYRSKSFVSLFLNRRKEENKKLWTEKEELENELKATLGCVDQLQVGRSWILSVASFF